MPEVIDIFISPIRDSLLAQAGTVGLLLLTFCDIIFGVVNAAYFQQNFSSHEFRKGLFRKLGNFGMLIVADIIDALLIGGLDLGFQPVYVFMVGAFCIMEVCSIFELWAEAHPEYKGTGIWKLFERAKGQGKDA